MDGDYHATWEVTEFILSLRLQTSGRRKQWLLAFALIIKHIRKYREGKRSRCPPCLGLFFALDPEFHCKCVARGYYIHTYIYTH